MPNNRILFLDTSRAIAMFLVVFAHLYAGDSQERLYIYAFHMPFFFLISGMLHKEQPVLRSVVKYSKSLLIPTLTYLLIGGLFMKFYHGWHFLGFVSFSWEGFRDSWGFPMNGPVWFLIALFYVKVLADIYLRNKVIGLLSWGAVFYVTSSYINPSFICSGMMAFPIYLIGYKSKAVALQLSEISWLKWLFPLFFAISVLLTLFNGRVSMVGHNFGNATPPLNYFVFYLNGIVGSLGLLCLSFFVKRPNRIITTVATSLITIVGLHAIFLDFFGGTPKNYYFTIPITILIMALCCVAHWLMDRYFPFLLGKRILPTFDGYYGIVHDFVCSFLPLQRKIVFDNFGGRGMGDDPKYIALYIKEHYPDVKLIWLLADMNTPMPAGITPVNIYSHKAKYHLFTAKIWVDNIKNFRKTPKRKGQFYLQTWHGGILGLKLAEAQIEETLQSDYVKAAKKDASLTDLMYSDNDFVKSIFEKEFWYEGEVLKCDVPRVSIIMHPAKELRARVMKAFNIPTDKRVVMYAPTWRDLEDSSLFVWDYERILDALSSRFGGDFVMLLRLHPNLAKISGQMNYSNRIISASQYPDMQELLAVSDVLISDYSSCFFEFGITYKPVFLYGPDVFDYQKDRGLLFDLNELPFEMNTSMSALEQTILHFDDVASREKMDQFCKRIRLQETGHGAEQVSKILLQHLS